MNGLCRLSPLRETLSRLNLGTFADPPPSPHFVRLPPPSPPLGPAAGRKLKFKSCCPSAAAFSSPAGLGFGVADPSSAWPSARLDISSPTIARMCASFSRLPMAHTCELTRAGPHRIASQQHQTRSTQRRMEAAPSSRDGSRGGGGECGKGGAAPSDGSNLSFGDPNAFVQALSNTGPRALSQLPFPHVGELQCRKDRGQGVCVGRRAGWLQGGGSTGS